MTDNTNLLLYYCCEQPHNQGKLFIVHDVNKFGIRIQNNRTQQEEKMAAWKSAFQEQTGFTFQDYNIHKNMVYVEATNVNAGDLGGLEEKMKGVTYKTIREAAKAALSDAEAASVAAAAAAVAAAPPTSGGGGASGAKRKASEISDGMMSTQEE